MNKCRLATLVIDCRTQHLDDAARFSGAALGLTHPSRVHIDIETDDVDSEVARLEPAFQIRSNVWD